MKRRFSRQSEQQQQQQQKPRVFPTGLIELSNPPDSIIDVVFIHDISEPRDIAWPSTESGDTWIKDVLQGDHADMTARILAFGYDASHVQKLDDLLSMNFLTKCARELLYLYPFYSSNQLEPDLSEEANKRNAPEQAVSGERRTKKIVQEAMGQGRITSPVDTSRQTVFVCHGFGGLIYEQAVTLAHRSKLNMSRTQRTSESSNEPECDTRRQQLVRGQREHTALLFNTPHYPSGIASWAVLSASVLNIPAPATTDAEKWEPYTARLQKFHRMQLCFLRVIKVMRLPIWAIFATDRLPKSKLSISPRWFEVPSLIMVWVPHNDHFTMTRSIVDEDPDRMYEHDECNIYRKTSMYICEWAEAYSERSSDLKTLVLQNIESTSALLDIVAVSSESIDDPLSRLSQTGKHVLEALQFLKDCHFARSSIMKCHSRNEYRSKTNALRDSTQDFQSNINHALSVAEDANQRFQVLFQRTTPEDLNKSLGIIGEYMDWAMEPVWPRVDTSVPNTVIRAMRHNLDKITYFQSLTERLPVSA